MSFVKTINSTGPRTELWRTPLGNNDDNNNNINNLMLVYEVQSVKSRQIQTNAYLIIHGISESDENK